MEQQYGTAMELHRQQKETPERQTAAKPTLLLIADSRTQSMWKAGSGSHSCRSNPFSQRRFKRFKTRLVEPAEETDSEADTYHLNAWTSQPITQPITADHRYSTQDGNRYRSCSIASNLAGSGPSWKWTKLKKCIASGTLKKLLHKHDSLFSHSQSEYGQTLLLGFSNHVQSPKRHHPENHPENTSQFPRKTDVFDFAVAATGLTINQHLEVDHWSVPLA